MAQYYKDENNNLQIISDHTSIPSYTTEEYERLDALGLIPIGSVFAISDDEIDDDMQKDIDALEKAVEEVNNNLPKNKTISGTTNAYGEVVLTETFNDSIFSVVSRCSYPCTLVRNQYGTFVIFNKYKDSSLVKLSSTEVTFDVYYI